MGSKHCSVLSRGELARRSKFPYESPNKTYPNYFVTDKWFGFVFYLDFSSNFSDILIDIHFYLVNTDFLLLLTYKSTTNGFYRHTLLERGKSAKTPYAVGSAGRCDVGESR